MKRPALLAILLPGVLMAMETTGFDAAQATKFADLALECVHKEYPNKIAHAMSSDADVKPPRELTPAFYGCFDWHSAVHGHWLLARVARQFPNEPVARRARAALAKSLTTEKLAGEVRYFTAEGRGNFERPYGLAWLLQLGAELREWDTPESRSWASALKPLEDAIVQKTSAWLPKLSRPIRTGEHNNTAFGLGLMLDAARQAGRVEFERLIVERAKSFYEKDRGCPLGYEPSGEDFLSPCLAEADLMRRVLEPKGFAGWFERFLPVVDVEATEVTDVTDGKLYHLAGLNLSRAWMLEGILEGTPGREPELRPLARRLREAGLKAIKAEHYEGGHWLGSFGVYLVSGRGLSQRR